MTHNRDFKVTPLFDALNISKTVRDAVTYTRSTQECHFE